MPTSGRRSTSESEARALSQEAFEKSGKPLTKDDGERVSIANELKTNIKAIAEAMLPQVDEQNGPNKQEPHS